jgi:hypothetical protein
MGIRLASTETKSLEIDGDTLDVRTDLSKRDFNRLLRMMPQDIDSEKGFTPGQASEFTAALFDTIVTGWSISEPATVETYLALAYESAAAIDSLLIEHFNSLTPSAKENSKSGTTSK